MLATSRRKGCSPGAIDVELGPLALVADAPGGLSPAATLWLERSGHGADGKAVTDSSGSRPRDLDPRVADRAERIAAALEGNPLAIELSAPSAQILGLDGLLARIASAPDHPEALGALRGAMRSTLERSFELLSEPERAARPSSPLSRELHVRGGRGGDRDPSARTPRGFPC